MYGHLSYQLARAQMDDRLRAAARRRLTAPARRRSLSLSLPIARVRRAAVAFSRPRGS